MAKIADISKYQKDVDWKSAAEELDFVILRASCGLTADTKICRNMAACTQYGIPFHAYHYLKATGTYTAKLEAEEFYKIVDGSDALFYVIDCEDDGITKLERKTAGTAKAIVAAFMVRLRELGVARNRIAVYIGHHLYKTWNLDYDGFAYVWIPRYGSNNGKPQTKPDYACDLWQYTSVGKMAGVNGNVDLNQLTGSKPLSFFTSRPRFEKRIETNVQFQDTHPFEWSENAMFTGKQLAEFALSVYANKWVYWYGTCGYKCTSSLLTSKKNQYPSHYTPSRESGYKADISNGKMCADCVGLIKAFFWMGGKLDGANKYACNGCPDRSANGMFGLCDETGKIGTIPDIPGLVVWHDKHIGVYVGGGMTVEMKGFSYDCVKKKVTDGSWTKWGKLPATMLTYTDEAAPEPIMYRLGDRIPLEKGDEGADVAELQATLRKLGYDIGTYGVARDGVDGDFGSKTQSAVRCLQEAAGLLSTGILDTATYKELLEATSTSDAEIEQPEMEDTPDKGSAPAYVLIMEGDEKMLRLVQSAYGGTLATVDSVVLANG